MITFQRSAAVAAIAAICLLAACASRPAVPPSDLPSLRSTDGQTYAFADLLSRPQPTVLVFFSIHCPVQIHHDAALIDAAKTFSDRGVRLFMVDSEYGGALERDREAGLARGYPFPFLLDPGGRWADALGARFSTYSVVLAGGAIRYRGGIDSSKVESHASDVPWLTNALTAILAGADPNPAETHALGCALQKW